MINYIKTKLKELRDRREAKIKADEDKAEEIQKATEESLSRLLKKSDERMTSKPCPFVEGNCRRDCVHFIPARRTYHFHPSVGSTSTIKPAGCRLWGTKSNS